MSRRERVLAVLKDAERTQVNGGWVCMRTLIDPMVGGNRAGARLHELKDHGYAINGVCIHTDAGTCRQCIRIDKKHPCDCDRCEHYAANALHNDEIPTRLTAWRIAGVPAEQPALPLTVT